MKFQNGHLVFRRGTICLPLRPGITAELDRLPDRRLVLGVRPEDVSEVEPGVRAGAIEGRIESVLPVGSDQYLGLTVEGVECFFRVGKDRPHAEGAPVALAINPARLHLFDPRTGMSI